MKNILIKPIVYGLLASIALFAVYFLTISAISGQDFAIEQFKRYGFFMTALSVGFGAQIALYSYLRAIVRERNISAGVVVASGMTSIIAMVSCGAHCLVSILPIIGITGAVALINQLQIELFWLGLALNVIGIVYIGKKIVKCKRAHVKEAEAKSGKVADAVLRMQEQNI